MGERWEEQWVPFDFYDFFEPVGNPEVTVPVDFADVAGVEPAVFVEGFGGCGGVVEIGV